MPKVKVDLPNNSYMIEIGYDILGQIGQEIAEFNFSKQLLLITDDNVEKLYADTVQVSLKQQGYFVETFVIPAGESSKSFDMAKEIYTKAIKMGLDRKGAIIALGGGVVGDLAGYIASTYLRGIPFIQVPTSLLAQVDSSVGGKVAINHELGKNLIGSFYQPKKVLIDLKCLETLPKREIISGMAEIIKYGFIYDQNLFSYLSANSQQLMALNFECLAKVVSRSCEIKADVVRQDEKEANLRAILNFGHTIAHAIESNTKYKLYTHGEAVGIGLYGAVLLSHYHEMVDVNTVRVTKELLEKFELPLQAKQCNVDTLFEIVGRDKKAVNGKVKWILLAEIGKVIISDQVSTEQIKKVLHEIVV